MPSALAMRLESAGICISGEHPPETIIPSWRGFKSGTFQRHLRGAHRHLRRRGVRRFSGGAGSLVARLRADTPAAAWCAAQ